MSDLRMIRLAAAARRIDRSAPLIAMLVALALLAPAIGAAVGPMCERLAHLQTVLATGLRP